MVGSISDVLCGAYLSVNGADIVVNEPIICAPLVKSDRKMGNKGAIAEIF